MNDLSGDFTQKLLSTEIPLRWREAEIFTGRGVERL